MAAYEDFEFFRTAKWRAARRAPAAESGGAAEASHATSSPASDPRREKDALRTELEQIHLEVRRLRAHVRRRRTWRKQLGRFVSRLLPGARLRESA